MCNADCAVECFNKGFNCAQSVFSTYSEQLGLDKTSALKISGGFGGGMCHLGETCGVVTGAFMLIGLKYGKAQEDDNAAKEKTAVLVREFAERFKAINGSIKCTELIGYDLSTEEGRKALNETKSWKTVCAKMVRDASQIVEELLELK